MLIFDRYLLRIFTRVLLISFISFFGLYFVVDAFQNIDVFITASGERGGGLVGLCAVCGEYYSPRILMFFDQAAAILALVASLFTLGWMQRTNELTAVMAAGIAPHRVVKPLLAAVVVVSGLSVVNRELLIPNFRDQLTRDANDWLGQTVRAVHPRYDNETDIYLSGRATVPKHRHLVEPHFRLPATLAGFGHQLQAELGVYQEATDAHPAGYLLLNVHQPAAIDSLPAGRIGDRTVLYTGRDFPWVAPGQCFVATRVDFDQLQGGNLWHAYTSSRQLIAALRNPSLDYGADVRRAIHARLLQPLSDLLLFLMGLSIVFTQRGRNLFVAVGLCAGLIVLFLVVNLACQALGNNYLLSPAFSAWCPIVLFGPAAYYMAWPIWQ